SSPSPSWALRLRRPRATSKGRSSARPRAITCRTRPVARSQTSITIAIAGSARTRLGSGAQGPGRIQNAPSSHRYQVGRTVGPLVATRAVRGWARKASMSKGGGCVTGSFSDPSRPAVSRFAGGHHRARRTRVRSRSNLARPPRLAHLLRGHWAIGGLHPLRDIPSAKDDSQVHFLTSEQWVGSVSLRASIPRAHAGLSEHRVSW